MKKSIGTLLIFILAAMPTSAETVEDLDKWFRAGYAALYVENSWDRAEEFAQYFSDEIAVRSNDGWTSGATKDGWEQMSQPCRPGV